MWKRIFAALSRFWTLPREHHAPETAGAVARRALQEDALAELLLGRDGYTYFPAYSPMVDRTDLTVLLGALCEEDLGFGPAEVRARLEKAVRTIVEDYEGLVPVATVLLMEALHRERKRPSFGLPLDSIAEDLRRAVARYRQRLLHDKAGEGRQYPDGLLGELRRLSKNTERLGGPGFAGLPSRVGAVIGLKEEDWNGE